MQRTKNVTRGTAIRQKCLDCSGGSYGAVRNCSQTNCTLYRYRMGREQPGLPGGRVTRNRAIRLMCRSCCCGNWTEVRRCAAKKCPLYPYRLGKINRDA